MNHYKLVFLALDVGDVHIVGRGAKIFELLASEDVNRDEMDLSVTVLAGLGSAHFDDLAGAALDDDESVLAERRALLRIGGGSTGIGALEGMFMLLDKPVSSSWKENGRAHTPMWWKECVRRIRGHLPEHRPPWLKLMKARRKERRDL